MGLTELCSELRNWFDKAKIFGEFEISNGSLIGAEDWLKDGQYYRIVGSLFNDGVHVYPSEDLVDESFDGAVWAMAVPPAVIALSEEIDEWVQKYGESEGVKSPYFSESFGGYSYQKSSGFSSNGSSPQNTASWQYIFKNRLDKWRKI